MNIVINRSIWIIVSALSLSNCGIDETTQNIIAPGSVYLEKQIVGQFIDGELEDYWTDFIDAAESASVSTRGVELVGLRFVTASEMKNLHGSTDANERPALGYCRRNQAPGVATAWVQIYVLNPNLWLLPPGGDESLRQSLYSKQLKWIISHEGLHGLNYAHDPKNPASLMGDTVTSLDPYTIGNVDEAVRAALNVPYLNSLDKLVK